MSYLYISDLHFGHSDILECDKRPFSTIEENDAAIINNWNNKVSDDDYVFILGDVSYYDYEQTIDILNSLSGNIIIIRGNHDHRWLDKVEDIFHDLKIHECLTVVDYYHNEPVYVSLCHYPIAVWDKQFDGGLQLYGHTHNNQHDILNHPEMAGSYNVGCMMPYMNYTPKTLEEIIDSNI